jgi:hypothetical protein
VDEFGWRYAAKGGRNGEEIPLRKLYTQKVLKVRQAGMGTSVE